MRSSALVRKRSLGMMVSRPMLHSADWYVDAREHNGVGSLTDLSGNGNPMVYPAPPNDALFLPHNKETYVYFPAVATNSMYTPDAPGLDIVSGNLGIIAEVALDNWATGVHQCLAEKGADDSYGMFVTPSGGLQLNWKANGTGVSNAQSTANLPWAGTLGARGWVQGQRNPTTGNVAFTWSNDGVTWTGLGTNVAGLTGTIAAGTRPLFIGEREGGALMAKGKFYNVKITDGGTVRASMRAQDITSPYQSVVGGAGETWTIARAAYGVAGNKISVVDRPVFLANPITWLSAVDSNILDLGTAPATVVLAARVPVIPTFAAAYFLKKNTLGVTNTALGWAFRTALVSAGGFQNLRLELGNNTSNGDTVSLTTTPFAGGQVSVGYWTRDGITVTLGVNGDTTTMGDNLIDLTNTIPTRINRTPANSSPGDMEFLGAAVYKRHLTAVDLAQAVAEFN